MPKKTSKTAEEHEAADNGMEGRGRAANRRDAKTFDVLALELIELPPDKVARLPVTEELRRTLHDAGHTKAKAARRRHLRKLAGMLRTSPSEVAAIKAFLAGRTFTRVTGEEENEALEAIRNALCIPENFTDSLHHACEELPALDVLAVRELCIALHALDVEAQQQAKSYRLLFKELRRAKDELGE